MAGLMLTGERRGRWIDAGGHVLRLRFYAGSMYDYWNDETPIMQPLRDYTEETFLLHKLSFCGQWINIWVPQGVRREEVDLWAFQALIAPDLLGAIWPRDKIIKVQSERVREIDA